MVYALHSRLTFSGLFNTVAAPTEEWSFRLNLGPITVGGVVAGDLNEAAVAWNTGLGPRISTGVRLQEVKHARIGADGLYTEEPDILAVDLPGSASGGAQYPNQIALAVSLNTDRRGPTGKGRFYMPGVKSLLDGTGVISAVDAQAHATAAANFLSQINQIGAFGPVVIASSKGYNTAVQSVRVGRVLDTIRSRRAQMDESYGADVAVSQLAD